MKKGWLVFTVLVLLALLTACQETNNKDVNNYYGNTNKVAISLQPIDPSALPMRPGIKTIGVLNISSKGKNQLYGLDLEVVSNGYYLYNMIPLFDKIWVENNAHDIVFYQEGDIQYNLWGVYDLPVGDSQLFIKGDIGFAQYPSIYAPLDPAPAFNLKINNIYTSGELLYDFPLEGETIYPVYAGTNQVFGELHPASPSGTIGNGRYELLIFNLWTDHGDATFWDLSFSLNSSFKGVLSNCQLKTAGDEYLNDRSRFLTDTFPDYYILLDKSTDSLPWAHLTTAKQRFSLICDVWTYEANQTLNISYSAGYWSPGDSGDFQIGFPAITGNTLFIP
ncbi:MAG: hypothetical protein NTX82_05300 [Candidatus Parcubacteria bacterium]|nr:hypothetical protein [Candidatus Parcubacteria bacterium]